jgi:hypothetical protein
MGLTVVFTACGVEEGTLGPGGAQALGSPMALTKPALAAPVEHVVKAKAGEPASVGSAAAPGQAGEGDDFSIQTALFSYSATNTNSATQNTVDRNITLNAGDGIVVGTCGVGGGSLSSGDTLLRLFDPSGVQVAANDDACGGLGSRFLYIAPTTGVYLLRAGCFNVGSCSGTVGVGLSVLSTFYSATGTNSATVNSFSAYTFANSGDRLTIGTCDLPGASSVGDTYLRLFTCTGTEVAANNDGPGFSTNCGLGSELVYTVPSDGCFEVRAGCLGNGSCSGTLVISRE